jgi:glyoxylase-like metal-dependent hydrolase (beta-lactamase superfamily II)
MFPGGVGNTRGNKKDFASLINDVEHKLFDRCPDDTWFYPGHGKDSTLGAERSSLAEWQARELVGPARAQDLRRDGLEAAQSVVCDLVH